MAVDPRSCRRRCWGCAVRLKILEYRKRVARLREEEGGLAGQLVEGLPLLLQRALDVGRLTGLAGGVAAPQLGGRLEELVEPLAFPPEQLIDHPGRERGLGRGPDLCRFVLASGLLEA